MDDADPPAYAVRRDPARARWWTRPLALWLARRENRALGALPPMDAVPQLIRLSDGSQARSWQPGVPMHEARPRDPAYFRAAFRLVCRLHRAGVVHNDLAKEANWLVREDGSPALIDFQLAWAPRRRGRLFRSLGREDIRHMLKHKRYYCAEHLSCPRAELSSRGRLRCPVTGCGWASRSICLSPAAYSTGVTGKAPAIASCRKRLRAACGSGYRSALHPAGAPLWKSAIATIVAPACAPAHEPTVSD